MNRKFTVKELPKPCAYVKYGPVRFGVETGVMIGGASPCYYDAVPGKQYCAIHERIGRLMPEKP